MPHLISRPPQDCTQRLQPRLQQLPLHSQQRWAALRQGYHRLRCQATQRAQQCKPRPHLLPQGVRAGGGESAWHGAQ
jgi:hypothetical protein